MNRVPDLPRALRRLLAVTSALAIVMYPTIVRAADSDIVRVEEVWQLQVGEPNRLSNAPQVTMIMSPSSSLNEQYFVYTLNFRTLPDYQPGGMQVQLWTGQQVNAHRSASTAVELQHENETVRWTQEMHVENGTVIFEVKNGSSLSWGTFGGQDGLRQAVATGQSNLNQYRPAISLEQSGIGYAGNRVVSLTLQKIRWHRADGEVYEVSAPIDINQDLDPWE